MRHILYTRGIDFTPGEPRRALFTFQSIRRRLSFSRLVYRSRSNDIINFKAYYADGRAQRRRERERTVAAGLDKVLSL